MSDAGRAHGNTTPRRPFGAPLEWLLVGLYMALLVGVLLFWLHVGNRGVSDPLEGGVRALAVLPMAVLAMGVGRSRHAMSGAQQISLLAFLGALSLQVTVSISEAMFGAVRAQEEIETVVLLLVALTALVQAVIFGRADQARRRAEAEAASTDRLTGLMNRDGLYAYANRSLARSDAALLMIDLNLLREVNEREGHGGGDRHIRALAATLRGCLPVESALCRWGGDEFVALLPGCSVATAGALAELALAQCPTVKGDLPAFAFGVTERPASEPLERTLARADQALYEFKHEQRTHHDLLAPGSALEDLLRHIELLDTPAQLVETGLDLISTLLRFDGCTYGERMEEGWVVRRIRGPGLSVEQVPTLPTEGEGVVGRAARDGRTVWSSDYAREPDALPQWRATGLKSLVVTPVSCRGQVVGILALFSFQTWRAITPQVRWMLEALALRLGHALDLQAVASEVRSSLEGGLLGLGAAMEARDLETGGHTARVVGLAEELGEAYGLTGAALEELRQGAYLHDIGKLAIPDAVLLKPGRLNDEEWRLMRLHAERGFEMASRIPNLSSGTLDLIRLHHERWDGSGYPLGLRGESIPLPARLFAVVDVYDALVSERSYKRAWSHEEACAEIARGAGHHFDPHVAVVFAGLPSVQARLQAADLTQSQA